MLPDPPRIVVGNPPRPPRKRTGGGLLLPPGIPAYFVASPPSGGLHRPPELLRMCRCGIPPAPRLPLPGEPGSEKAVPAPCRQERGLVPPHVLWRLLRAALPPPCAGP